jgi:hypothetical protein
LLFIQMSWARMTESSLLMTTGNKSSHDRRYHDKRLRAVRTTEKIYSSIAR